MWASVRVAFMISFVLSIAFGRFAALDFVQSLKVRWAARRDSSARTPIDFDKVRRQWYFIKTETDYDLTPFSDWPPADADDE